MTTQTTTSLGLGDIMYETIGVVKPELYLALLSLLLLVYGVYRQPKATQAFAWVGIVALALTGYLVATSIPAESVLALNGMFVSNYFTAISKILILAASALVLMVASGWLSQGEGKPFETIILILLSTLGMMLMVSAGDFLALYVALELSSLALYVLASINRDHAKSAEAGLKYFVLGALASGMMLFGISLVYGFAGSIRFATLAEAFAGGEASKAVLVGMVMILVGFCFKLSAAPFHMWAPDVYEGAPTPVTAFFATAPKIAALMLFTRVLAEPFGGLIDQWQPIIIAVSVLSMLVGALAAMMQTNIKRLLAYSGIGHAGFMLMGLAAANQAGLQAMLIYLALYIFMSIGAFTCVLLMRVDDKALEQIKDLKGLAQSHPWLAATFALFMFSMAGIPPLAGFFGKFYVVISVVESGMLWLAVVGVVTSVIACFYYLKVVKVMYFDAAELSFNAPMTLMMRIGLLVCALVTALYFVLPTPLIAQATLASQLVFVP